MIGLTHYLVVGAILFVAGVFGIFVNRKNVIVILMSIELMLLAVNINFVAFSAHLGDLVGQVFTLFILTVAAAEALATLRDDAHDAWLDDEHRPRRLSGVLRVRGCWRPDRDRQSDR